jgi:adenosylcobinamide-GDP ribazoletransferase
LFKTLRIAIGFLTVIPVNPRPVEAGDLGAAVKFFPVVGVIQGSFIWGLLYLLPRIFPIGVAVWLSVFASALLNGLIHWDGFADTADSLGSRNREKSLAIMKDSRVGSYGVAAAVSVLLLEFACLASLPTDYRGGTLVLAGLWSRWSMVALLWGFPAARGSGLAAGLKPQVGWPHLAAATVLAIGLAVVTAGWAGMALGIGSGLLAVAGGRFAVAKLGGVTGDLCGGLGQLLEAPPLLAAVALANPA